MTLKDLMLSSEPLDVETLRSLVLVFDSTLAQRLVNVHHWHGDPRHSPYPLCLDDGRWILSADVLAECVPGGLMHGGFSHLDPSRFDSIDVVPLSSVNLADPQPPQLVPEPEPEESPSPAS